MFLYGIIYNPTYRNLREEFLVSEVFREALNLKDVPHYFTICKAVERLKEEDLKKLLEESSKLLEFYWVERRQCELLLCEEEWKEKEELD